jgi:hypothetical protein
MNRLLSRLHSNIVFQLLTLNFTFLLYLDFLPDKPLFKKIWLALCEFIMRQEDQDPRNQQRFGIN